MTTATPSCSATGCGPRSATDADCVEAVEVLSETPGAELPKVGRERLGLQPGQKNVLVRVVLRHADRTLTPRRGQHVPRRRLRRAPSWDGGRLGNHQSRERPWRSDGRVAVAEQVLTSRAA